MDLEIMEGVALRPDNTIYHPDFGDLTLDVMAELAELEKAERVEASVERLAIARENRIQGPHRFLKFGRVIAEIPEQDYDDQERLEPGYFTDPNSIKEFVKLVPETKVESVPGKPSITHPGLPALDA